MIDPRQDGAARGQSPRREVHVAEVLEQSEGTIEAARQGVVVGTVEELRERGVQDECASST